MGIDNTAAAEQRRRERRALKEEIQTLWAEIEKDPERSNPAWEALIPALDRYARPAILSIAKGYAYWNEEDIQDICSTVHVALAGPRVPVLYKARLEITPELYFSDYCRGIYQHKARDHFAEKAQIPLDEADWKEDEQRPEVAGSLSQPESDAIGDLSDQEMVLQYYVDEVMNCKGNRFHVVMLCYSKILPVILGQTACNSADKWAWEHMQGRTLKELSDIFTDLFNHTAKRVRARWGQKHWEALEGTYVSRKSGKEMRLGDAILTDEFEKSTTKNWVSRLDERVKVHMIRKIMESRDSSMIRLAREHTEKKDIY